MTAKLSRIIRINSIFLIEFIIGCRLDYIILINYVRIQRNLFLLICIIIIAYDSSVVIVNFRHKELKLPVKLILPVR